ncbi:MAG: hypothetical protein ACYTFA_17815 [Planctomycetota bacterium]|jgi:hypothetical protein
MKATRRHELRENDLAHAIETARAYLGEHGTKVGLILVFALAAVVVVGITVRTHAGNVERAWVLKSKLLFEDPDGGKESLEKLRRLTSEATDESFVITGLIEQGRQALRLAQQVESPPDPDLNDQARDAFDSLLERFPDNALAFGLAYSGLATVAENDFALDADLAHRERAKAHLQAILDNPALNSLPFHRVAADRLVKLDATCSIVRFAPPSESEEAQPAPVPQAPITITPTPITFDKLPADLKAMAESEGETSEESSGEAEQVEPVDYEDDDDLSEEAGEDVPVDANDEPVDTP